MKKLIILLFLLISTPTLAGDQHTEIDINVSDIVASIGKPDYSYAVLVEDGYAAAIGRTDKIEVSHAYWFHEDVFIICKLIPFSNVCYMDKTLEELKALNNIDIQMLVRFIEKNLPTP